MLTVTPVQMIFYLFAAMATISALSVITARNPVRSVLSLVVTFFSMSGVWMLLQAEFLSLILLLVYVGAVMTLFLFVVMMLSIDKESKRSGFVKYLPFGIIVIVLLIGILFYVAKPMHFVLAQSANAGSQVVNQTNLQALGSVLYTDYVYPFELAGVLLLAVMVAAIALAHRPPRKRKIQKPHEQINVKPEDCVRLVKMPSEPKVQGN